MKGLQTIVFVALLFLTSCDNKKFEREEYLSRYVDEKLKNDVPVTGEYNLIILQTLFCGACSDEVLDAINTSFSNDTLTPNIVVMQPSRKKIKEKLINLRHITYILDNENNIGRYGLNYPHDIYFRMSGTQIKHWMFIDEDALNKFNKAHGFIHANLSSQ